MNSNEFLADHELGFNVDKGNLNNFSQKIPQNLTNSQQSPEVIKSDLLKLQEKISSLESRLQPSHQSSQIIYCPKVEIKKTKHSASSSLLKSFEREERELEELERSITSTPSKKSSASLNAVLDRLRTDLLNQRQKNVKLRKSNDGLKKMLNHREDLHAKLAMLQEDHYTLIQSFERSENIRNKQKEMIESLKNEILEYEAAENEKGEQKKPKKKRPIIPKPKTKRLYSCVNYN
ncbi:unnamed protein product [Blepharisma stoltei]|uniref:Uncharacterized protein n=1 Tax=Blepharisma stoltei TaxID=1481888 RepID=A0AAU9KS78_9CILI|nr:unnamed protein product [Blepharisma stoltei]